MHSDWSETVTWLQQNSLTEFSNDFKQAGLFKLDEIAKESVDNIKIFQFYNEDVRQHIQKMINKLKDQIILKVWLEKHSVSDYYERLGIFI